MDQPALQFTFALLSSAADSKTNILCITLIGTRQGRTFSIPDEVKPVQHHTEIMKTTAYAKVKNSLTKRGHTRKIWINLTKELMDIYLDEGGNLQFNNKYLEEINASENADVRTNASEQSLVQLLEKLLEKSQEKNIGRIARDFTIEKFNGKNSNANQWITDFEKECERFNITKNEEKIEILKSFMEKGAVDWYSCTLVKLTIEADWEEWKKNFCTTFANKGWTSIRYALAFKYQAGSLLEYAIKKERLLLEVRKSIDDGTLIDLIATGLPNFVSDRIDREKLEKTEDLYNEIGKLEHLAYKRNPETKKNKSVSKEKNEKTACEICKNKGKGTRFHPESECWFKNKEDKIKHVNNSVLEVELNDNDPKN